MPHLFKNNLLLLPSSKNDSSKVPPWILVIWMASRFPDPFSLITASTANLEKKSLCWLRILDDKVVLAMFIKSSRKSFSSLLWSVADFSRASFAAAEAFRQPAMMVWGWILMSTNFSASLMSSLASTVTEVVPSPTSLSCTRDISTSTLAAGLSTPTALKMVAPSLVTSIEPEQDNQ